MACTLSSLGAQSSEGRQHYRAVFNGPFAANKPGVAGAPFAAEQEVGLIVGYSDGRRIPHTFKEWLYRDAEGRTRVERLMMNSPGANANVRLVQIIDPIGEYEYVIDTVGKVAHRIKAPVRVDASEESKITLLSNRDDPKSGKSWTKLLNYHAGEQDPSLFQPPEGYWIIDETGQFRIDIPLPDEL